MRPAVQLGGDRRDLLLRQIDHRNPRPGRPKSERHLAADPAGAAGEEHALALEACGEVPGHRAPLVQEGAFAARRRCHPLDERKLVNALDEASSPDWERALCLSELASLGKEGEGLALKGWSNR